MRDGTKVWVDTHETKTGKTTYHLRWIDEATGRRKSKSMGGDLKRAQREASALEGKLREGVYDGEVKRITWPDFVEEHCSIIPGEENRRQARRALDEFGTLIGKSPRAIRYADIELFAAKLRDKGNSEATVAKKLRYMRAAMRAAVRRRYIKRTPMDGYAFPRIDEKEIREIVETEETALLDKAESLHGYRFRGFVHLAIWSGARCGELLALTWNKIERRTKGEEELIFPKTKGKKVRKVPIGPEELLVCDKLLAIAQAQDGPFTDWSYDDVQGMFDKSATEAKVKHVTLHDCRRTFITRLIRKRVPLPVVQRLAGHSTITTTLKFYNAITTDDLREGVASLRKVNAG